jgi:hypothetical protein
MHCTPGQDASEHAETYPPTATAASCSVTTPTIPASLSAADASMGTGQPQNDARLSEWLYPASLRPSQGVSRPPLRHKPFFSENYLISDGNGI